MVCALFSNYTPSSPVTRVSQLPHRARSRVPTLDPESLEAGAVTLVVTGGDVDHEWATTNQDGLTGKGAGGSVESLLRWTPSSGIHLSPPRVPAPS